VIIKALIERLPFRLLLASGVPNTLGLSDPFGKLAVAFAAEIVCR
jgi:hypothetical protein